MGVHIFDTPYNALELDVPMTITNTYGSFETITEEPQQTHRIHIVELNLEDGIGRALGGRDESAGCRVRQPGE